jgi:hypothetical protein
LGGLVNHLQATAGAGPLGRNKTMTTAPKNDMNVDHIPASPGGIIELGDDLLARISGGSGDPEPAPPENAPVPTGSDAEGRQELDRTLAPCIPAPESKGPGLLSKPPTRDR